MRQDDEGDDMTIEDGAKDFHGIAKIIKAAIHDEAHALAVGDVDERAVRRGGMITALGQKHGVRVRVEAYIGAVGPLLADTQISVGYTKERPDEPMRPIVSIPLAVYGDGANALELERWLMAALKRDAKRQRDYA